MPCPPVAEAKTGTCCYCGRRTVLVPTARDGHELACASCGAPIHRMKPLRPVPARAASAHRPTPQPKKIKRKKARKPLWLKLVREVAEEIEDLFD